MAADLAAVAESTDAELVDRLRKGDPSAFEALYERYFKRVYGFAHKRLHNREDAEETTQEVFFGVFSSIEHYRGEASFAAWVFGITRRTIAARFKKKRHQTVPRDTDESSRPSPIQGAPGAEPTPLDTYEYRERLERMRKTLETRLSPEQQTLFRLHHLDHRPIDEIAQQLCKSEDAIKSSLYRARRLLLSR